MPRRDGLKTGGPPADACDVLMTSIFDKDLYAVLGVPSDASLGDIRVEQRVAGLRAAVDAAAEVQDAARVVRAEAAAAADRGERRAEHARDILSTARSVAERAADRATDTAGDAAFADAVAGEAAS